MRVLLAHLEQQGIVVRLHPEEEPLRQEGGRRHVREWAREGEAVSLDAHREWVRLCFRLLLLTSSHICSRRKRMNDRVAAGLLPEVTSEILLARSSASSTNPVAQV